MPRHRHSSSGATTTLTSTSATVHAAERILQKDIQLRTNIQKLHASALLLAESIAINGSVEASLRNDDDPNDPQNEQMNLLLKEQRDQLKSLTEGHVSSMRYIDAFMNATRSIKDDAVRDARDVAQDNSADANANADADADTGTNTEAPDYESILQTKLELEKHSIEKEYIDLHDEEMPRKIRQYLNEKEVISTTNNHNNHNNNNNNIQNNDDDDDIEIEINQNQTQNESSYKCPLTGMIFQNPVRNKVCHHTYDQHAIHQHIVKMRKRDCPVMGCSNSSVTMSQMEVDEEMILKVRRFLRIQEGKKKRNAMSQDYDVDDDDDGYDDDDTNGNGNGGDGFGMTVIE